jgi:hypothetical protein
MQACISFPSRPQVGRPERGDACFEAFELYLVLLYETLLDI